MTKRTFVLFFLLLALLTLPVRDAHAARLPGDCVETNETVAECHDLDDGLICEEDCLNNIPIIQADETKWKENLSDLLGHRFSNYRFVTFESVASSNIIFWQSLKMSKLPSSTFTFFNNLVVLPDYYSFLHRLSPF